MIDLHTEQELDWNLFIHLADCHGIHLTATELQDIKDICNNLLKQENKRLRDELQEICERANKAQGGK